MAGERSAREDGARVWNDVGAALPADHWGVLGRRAYASGSSEGVWISHGRRQRSFTLKLMRVRRSSRRNGQTRDARVHLPLAVDRLRTGYPAGHRLSCGLHDERRARGVRYSAYGVAG